jgi:hypothetical protein
MIEHPIESLIAGALLLGLLFGAGDIGRDAKSAVRAPGTLHAAPLKNL